MVAHSQHFSSPNHQHLAGPMRGLECAFCRRNREPPQVFRSHQLKDHSGKVTCPQLYRYRCELCGATGEEAHTRSYCPSAQRLHQQMRQHSSQRPLPLAAAQPPRSSSQHNETADSSPEDPTRAPDQASTFSISLGSDRMFRNMGLVTSTRFNSAGRLRYPPHTGARFTHHHHRRDHD